MLKLLALILIYHLLSKQLLKAATRARLFSSQGICDLCAEQKSISCHTYRWHSSSPAASLDTLSSSLDT